MKIIPYLYGGSLWVLLIVSAWYFVSQCIRGLCGGDVYFSNIIFAYASMVISMFVISEIEEEDKKC